MPDMAWWTPSSFGRQSPQDLPALHPGEGVLDSGQDLAVSGVAFLLPGREFGADADPAR